MKRRTEPYQAPPAGYSYPICDGALIGSIIPLAPADDIRLVRMMVPDPAGIAAKNSVVRERTLDGMTEALADLDPMLTLMYLIAGLCLEHPTLEWETEPIEQLSSASLETMQTYGRAIAAECSGFHARRALRFEDIMGVRAALQSASASKVSAEKND